MLEKMRLMDKKYKVEVTVENKNDTYLSITRNGFSWSSLNIKDPVAEIPFIIAALQHHLSFVVLDSKDGGKNYNESGKQTNVF